MTFFFSYGSMAEEQDCMFSYFFNRTASARDANGRRNNCGVAWLCVGCRTSLSLQSHSLCAVGGDGTVSGD